NPPPPPKPPPPPPPQPPPPVHPPPPPNPPRPPKVLENKIQNNRLRRGVNRRIRNMKISRMIPPNDIPRPLRSTGPLGARGCAFVSCTPASDAITSATRLVTSSKAWL